MAYRPWRVALSSIFLRSPSDGRRDDDEQMDNNKERSPSTTDQPSKSTKSVSCSPHRVTAPKRQSEEESRVERDTKNIKTGQIADDGGGSKGTDRRGEHGDTGKATSTPDLTSDGAGTESLSTRPGGVRESVKRAKTISGEKAGEKSINSNAQDHHHESEEGQKNVVISRITCRRTPPVGTKANEGSDCRTPTGKGVKKRSAALLAKNKPSPGMKAVPKKKKKVVKVKDNTQPPGGAASGFCLPAGKNTAKKDLLGAGKKKPGGPGRDEQTEENKGQTDIK